MKRTGWLVTGFVALTCLILQEQAAAMTFTVYPGKSISIQGAINQAVAGDTILIYGQPGYEYQQDFTLKDGITLQGIANPVLNPAIPINLKTGTTLRGLTIKHFAVYGGYLVIPSGVQQATIDQCTLLNTLLIIQGNRNTLQRSIIKGYGTLLQISDRSSNNAILSNVFMGKPFYANGEIGNGALIEIGYSQLDTPPPQLSQNNLFSGNTIYGWGQASDFRGTVSYCLGVGLFQYHVGTGNRMLNTIIANSGRQDISGAAPFDVFYSLLEKGTASPSVRLNTGVLTGVNPQFVYPTTGDLRLQGTSPAIDKGYVPYYFFNALDPDGTLPDLGALPFDQRLTRTQ